jgi:hypothetical protein
VALVGCQHNQMLPDLELNGNYAGNGIGGAQILIAPGQPALAVPGGFGGTLGQLFGFRYPTYGFGITLRLPIRNHSAEAALGQAAVARESDLYSIRLQEQAVNLDVVNSIHLLEESKQALEAARISRDLARKTLQAEPTEIPLRNRAGLFCPGGADGVGSGGTESGSGGYRVPACRDSSQSRRGYFAGPFPYPTRAVGSRNLDKPAPVSLQNRRKDVQWINAFFAGSRNARRRPA